MKNLEMAKTELNAIKRIKDGDGISTCMLDVIDRLLVSASDNLKKETEFFRELKSNEFITRLNSCEQQLATAKTDKELFMIEKELKSIVESIEKNLPIYNIDALNVIYRNETEKALFTVGLYGKRIITVTTAYPGIVTDISEIYSSKFNKSAIIKDLGEILELNEIQEDVSTVASEILATLGGL